MHSYRLIHVSGRRIERLKTDAVCFIIQNREIRRGKKCDSKEKK